MDFVVRNNPGSTGLDGAFRVQVPPDAMQPAGLVFNQLCEVQGEDGRAVGCGIVWRAAEKLGSTPKTKPVRLSETMRDAFGIKEGGTVKLAPLTAGILRADRLILTDITLHPPAAGHDGEEDERWRIRCAYALSNVEAVAAGTTFDIAAKKGLKRRFVVESIRSRQAQSGTPHLYYINDSTQLDIGHANDSAPPSPGIPRHGTHFTPLSTDGIGGLVEQIQTLNARMRHVLQQARNGASRPTAASRQLPLVITGYEGTGKSMLLGRLELTGNFRKTIRLDPENLDGPATAKKKAIADHFNEARSHQPSLILFDDLEQLVPSADNGGPLLRTICSELDSILGARVLIVAATRSLQAVHPALLKSRRFVNELELPIPDRKAREHILNALFVSEGIVPGETTASALSSQTHGFTCEDLAKLIQVAGCCAQDRNAADALSRFPSDSTLHDSCDHDHTTAGASDVGAPDSHAANGHNTDADSNQPPLLCCTPADFASARLHVRAAALREILFTTPSTTWHNIGGSSQLRTQFDRVIGWQLHQGNFMKDNDLEPQKGMLLYGPPGCSKTLTAQAVAATYEMNFIAVKGAELISSYVGESERAVREIFRKARTASPCIIFFDEIDAIASERETGGAKGLNVLTTLLNEMDGFDSLSGVFVLAATNKPESLDPAIMRPGRFDQHLYLPPPDAAARKEIIAIRFTKGLEGVDVGDLVQRTDGYTGAEVVAVCKLAKEAAFARLLGEAGVGANLEGRRLEVRKDDFDSAMESVIPRVTKEMLQGYEAFAKGGI